MSLQASDLKKYNYFSTVSAKSLETLARRFSVVACPKNAEIVKEGDAADAFYFVKEGRLEVIKATGSGQAAKLSVVGSGQGFGEMALLTGNARCGTVRAMTAVTLYRLDKAAFEELVLQEPAFKEMLQRRTEDLDHFNRIKILQPFVLLEPDRMFALLARMTERTFSVGEDVIIQGEKGDYYYIIKSGSVSVLKKAKGEAEAKEVAVLSEGDGFGEEALIRDDPRNATCRAMEETVVYQKPR